MSAAGLDETVLDGKDSLTPYAPARGKSVK